jgi:hypothetical protein
MRLTIYYLNEWVSLSDDFWHKICRWFNKTLNITQSLAHPPALPALTACWKRAEVDVLGQGTDTNTSELDVDTQLNVTTTTALIRWKEWSAHGENFTRHYGWSLLSRHRLHQLVRSMRSNPRRRWATISAWSGARVRVVGPVNVLRAYVWLKRRFNIKRALWSLGRENWM